MSRRPPNPNYVKPPDALPAFPNAKRKRPKTGMGGGKKRRRWVDDVTGDIFEWDYRHGRVEMFNKLGKHVAEVDPNTGRELSGPIRERSIEP
jgi:Cytotoxic